MTQEVFPEVRAAMEALEARMKSTEMEIAQVKEDIKAKKAQVKTWRKALAAFSPRPHVTKKKALAA